MEILIFFSVDLFLLIWLRTREGSMDQRPGRFMVAIGLQSFGKKTTPILKGASCIVLREGITTRHLVIKHVSSIDPFLRCPWLLP